MNLIVVFLLGVFSSFVLNVNTRPSEEIAPDVQLYLESLPIYQIYASDLQLILNTAVYDYQNSVNNFTNEHYMKTIASLNNSYVEWDTFHETITENLLKVSESNCKDTLVEMLDRFRMLVAYEYSGIVTVNNNVSSRLIDQFQKNFFALMKPTIADIFLSALNKQNIFQFSLDTLYELNNTLYKYFQDNSENFQTSVVNYKEALARQTLIVVDEFENVNEIINENYNTFYWGISVCSKRQNTTFDRHLIINNLHTPFKYAIVTS